MREKEHKHIRRTVWKRGVAYLLAGLLFVGGITVPNEVKVQAAVGGINDYLTFTNGKASIGSYISSAGTELTGSETVTEGTDLFFEAEFNLEFVKLMDDMAGEGADDQSFRILDGIDAKLNLTAFTSEQIIEVEMLDGKRINIGTYRYYAENELSVGSPAGLYITFKKGGETEAEGGLVYLDKMLNPAAASGRDTTSISGGLKYHGLLNMNSSGYGDNVSIDRLGGIPLTVTVPDPTAPTNPNFSKSDGVYADGKLTWTITVEKNATSPNEYVLRDMLPESLLYAIPDIKVNTYTGETAGGDASVTVNTVNSGDTINLDSADFSEFPTPNQAYYRPDATGETKLAIPVKFTSAETKKIFTIVTEINPSVLNTTDKSITITNNASVLSISSSGLPPVTDTGTVTITKEPDKMSKDGVYNETTGQYDFEIIISNVNYSWMKDLVVYDTIVNTAEPDTTVWKLVAGSLKVYEDNGTPVPSVAETVTAVAGAPNKITTGNSTYSSIRDGFKLTLFSYDENLKTMSGTGKSSYKITYSVEVDPKYWEDHSEDP